MKGKIIGVLAFIALIAIVAVLGNAGEQEEAAAPATTTTAEAAEVDRADLPEDMASIRNIIRTASDDGERELTTGEVIEIERLEAKYKDVVESGDADYALYNDHIALWMRYDSFTALDIEEAGGYYREKLPELEAEYN